MRKRSNYKPKGVRPDNMAYILAGFKKLVDLPNENMVVRTKNHLALELSLKGQATRDDLDVLIAALNMTEALSSMQLGNDWADEIRAGQDALLAMCRRSRFVFTGPEMTAVKLAMEIHDAQLDQCTVQQVETAIALVASEIKAKRARVILEAA